MEVRPSPGRVDPLVGRDAELGALSDAVTVAAGGRPVVVLLTGEPGIGKTRLADECALVVVLDDLHWADARAVWVLEQLPRAFGDAAVAVVATPRERDPETLILEGELDAATAPSWVRLVTPGLQANQVVMFPLLGHSVYGKSPCSVKILASFLDNPMQPVDTSCVTQEARPFVTS